VDGAVSLFADAVDKLADDVTSLGDLEEHLHGERFVAAFVPPRDAPPFYYRSMFPDDAEGKEEWEEVCRTYGMPPQQTKEFYPPSVKDSIPVGATQAPPEPLVRVIAAYALLGIPLDELLDAFHPDPASVDAKTRERMELAAQGLRHEAGQFSKLARGGTIRRGPSTEELSPEELEAAYWMRRLQNDGVSIERIPGMLQKHGIGKFSGRKLSELRNLRIQPPS
jgi:hypothetical protein